MKESVNYLKSKTTWQYIVFKYKNDIDEAIDMADSIGVDFYKLISPRWRFNDPLNPPFGPT